jgi:hypothetical protein
MSEAADESKPGVVYLRQALRQLGLLSVPSIDDERWWLEQDLTDEQLACVGRLLVTSMRLTHRVEHLPEDQALQAIQAGWHRPKGTHACT